jgi:acetyl esterase/lipase
MNSQISLRRLPAILAAGLCLSTLSTLAAAAAEDGEVFRLYAGPAPGSETLSAPEQFDGQRVRNVTVPTLTVFRPPGSGVGGLVVLIAPGGGFEHLSIANEGYEVARELVAHGITAIVLKYRVSPRPGGAPPATAPPGGASAPSSPPSRATRVDELNSSAAARTAMLDGANAMRFIRAHARAWNLAGARIGVLGFSAGAVVAMQLALSTEPEMRPDFAAAIYGAMPGSASVPANAPPLFLAVATDDKVMGIAPSQAIAQAWLAAGRDVELHQFQSGGHGFGMQHQHTTSDHWIDEYLWWLEARGLLT